MTREEVANYVVNPVLRNLCKWFDVFMKVQLETVYPNVEQIKDKPTLIVFEAIQRHVVLYLIVDIRSIPEAILWTNLSSQ